MDGVIRSIVVIQNNYIGFLAQLSAALRRFYDKPEWLGKPENLPWRIHCEASYGERGRPGNLEPDAKRPALYSNPATPAFP